MTVDFAALTERYLTAQLAGDRREALRILVDEAIGRGATVVDIQANVIRAAQQEIGRMWQANRISIAQEHLATGVSQIVMAQLYQFAKPVARNRKVVTVACVEGELHDFPARLVADYLEHGGFVVRYLGANVPTHDLVAMIRASRPDLVALSTTMTMHVDSLREAIRRLREEVAVDLPILVGGHALAWAPDLANDLHTVAGGAHPSDVVEIAQHLTRES